jgi:hypothetical protein
MKINNVLFTINLLLLLARVISGDWIGVVVDAIGLLPKIAELVLVRTVHLDHDDDGRKGTPPGTPESEDNQQ